MSSNKTPKLAITMGDVAGIGPEIIVGGWPRIVQHNDCVPIVYGNNSVIEKAVTLLGSDCDVQLIDNPVFAKPSKNVIPCLNCASMNAIDVRPGEISHIAGEAAYHAIVTATLHAMLSKADAIVTTPINKKALNLAGCHFPGHTELIASRCGAKNFAMMLYLGPSGNIQGAAGLAVVHVTLHTAMQNIFDEITSENVLAKIRLANDFMLKMKGQPPAIGVCSLNPHAGENGLFGHEEINIITPTVVIAREEGINVSGPFPADTIMLKARNGEFDAVVAMFHDQGHIALKLLGMHQAVNITLGLPIIRTSVAHGTAFDIAWQGKANPASLIEACRVAGVLARNRRESS
ncbi:MAG: 4-hydroxythreonine-4-phosphate dehydrogenase PdxA [Planctomycetaceae bacterium]|nr:4-hydroxythreonine-4-phosphate dehydrogenase PdxA [Planctomycetaceae bacterium]